MTHVLVAVPAHNEADEIGGCLQSVRAAAVQALSTGRCDSVTIGVALNRCTDGTAKVVAETLTEDADHVITVDATSRTVGAVRARLIDEMTRLEGSDPGDIWVFNTDADSRVAVDWITRTLEHTTRSGAVAAAGMVELRDWVAPADVQSIYDQIITAGISGHEHTHVYGANLAVRLDAYRRVGGFSSVHAEDQDLVDRLRSAGEVVTTPVVPLVSTSAREPGRASAGLGALLQQIRDDAAAVLHESSALAPSS